MKQWAQSTFFLNIKEEYIMDIKEKITELVDKIKGDPRLMDSFKSDPVKTIEGIAGVDLPDDQIKAVAEGVMAKIGLDGIGDKLGGLFG